MRTATAWFTVLAVAGVAQAAGAVSIALPEETTSFRPGPGMEAAQINCRTCHSVDYVAIQPPKPRDFWKEEVNKMIKSYGATIPADQIDPIADYITRTYGIEAPGGPTGPAPGAPAPKP
jgi:mono/diheme cytochrome c family protein